MRTVIYARKSTESEDRQIQSLEDQIRELSKLAEREGLVVSEIFQEARSAKNPRNRPEFDRMVSEIEAGTVSGVLVWSVNRLSRNELEGGLIAHLLRSRKLSFIRTIDRAHRPEDDALYLAVEMGSATSEVQRLSANVSRGMRGKVERGWHPCKAPVGYRNCAETRRILPDPERFELVRQGWEALLAGRRLSDVHSLLVTSGLTVRVRGGVATPISHSRVYTLFRDPFYTGALCYLGESHKGQHEPMVTEDEFQRVQDRLNRHSWAKAQTEKAFAFGGTLKCAVCGCAIVGEAKVKHYPRTGRRARYVYYHCSGFRGCSKKAVREERLAELANTLLKRIQISRSTAEWLVNALAETCKPAQAGIQESIQRIEANTRDQERRVARLTELRVDGEISAAEFAVHRARLASRAESARAHLNQTLQQGSSIQRQVRGGLEMAVLAEEERSQLENPRVLGVILRVFGIHFLNLVNLELKLDPIIARITAFEPAERSSASPKLGDVLPLTSFWWTLVEELRTTALEEVRSKRCQDDAENPGDSGYLC